MSKKSILILGASSGMAASSARHFHNDGYEVILAARDLSKIETLGSEMNNSRCLMFDALDESRHASFLSEIGELPEIVLLAYGYLGDQSKGQVDPVESELILRTNYSSAVSILNLIAEEMLKREQGVIAAIGSVAGDRGRAKNYLYGSAKAGLHEYLSGLRQRLFGSGVRVVTIKPGFVKTAMLDGVDTPKSLTLTSDQAGKLIFKGIKSGKQVFYVDWKWRYLMLVIKHLPMPLFLRSKF